MIKFFSKKMLLLATVLVSSALIAEEACEEKTPASEQGHGLVNTQMMGAYNATARYDVKGSLDLYLTGSFIYWQTYQYGMTLAESVPATPIASGGKEHIHDFNFKFKPGFKVGLGIDLSHDNWDLFVEYTRLADKQRDHFTAPTGGYLQLATYAGTTNLADKVTVKYKQDFNIFDLSLLRAHYQGTKLTVTPSFGMRGGWMNQKRHDEILLVDKVSYNWVYENQKTWFIGPRLALNGNWHLGEGFRLYGNIGASLFYQLFKNHHQAWDADENLIENSYLGHKGDGMGRITPNVDTELGIAYASYFADNDWHVDILAGYTFQWFGHQNAMSYAHNTEKHLLTDNGWGDLFMHGLVVTLRLDF